MPDQSKYISKLAKARILIIGGSSGLGYALAEACLEYSAAVTISSSNTSRLDSAVSALKTSYPSHASNIHSTRVDLSRAETVEAELKRMLDSAVEAMGGEKLDHIVYTAGDALATIPLSEMNMENVMQAGQIRFFAPLMLAKYLPAYIAPGFKSSYTITTGVISEHPFPNWAAIAGYAGGHHSMVRNLALDLKPLRVNAVSPGTVDTALWRVEGTEREAMLKEMGEKTCTGRAGRAEDVVESYLAVLRDWNMTGSVVRSDGGAMLL